MGRADHQQVGVALLGGMLQGARGRIVADRDDLGVDVRLQASSLQRPHRVLAQEPLVARDRSAGPERIVGINPDERQPRRPEGLGQGDGVTAAVEPVDAGDHVVEHVGEPKAPPARRNPQPSPTVDP
jgi:hypothetical protein